MVASSTVRAAVAAAAVAVAVPAAGAQPAAQPWLTLFDGRGRAGWTMTGPGGFDLVDGTLVSRGGMGLLWYGRRRFGDFELQVDWKVVTRCANSGVFVRFPTRPASPSDAVESGYEVQIDDCDPRGPRYTTGAIYDHARATRAAARPAGRWNRYRIRVVGQRYTVTLNGAVVSTFVGARGRIGYVGLQNHDDASRVSFRRILVRPLR